MRLDSIRTRTAIVLLFIGVLIVLVVGGFWVYSTYETMKTDIRQSNLQDARMVSRYVDVFTNNIVIAERVTAGDRDTIEAIRQNDRELLTVIGDNMASTIPDLDVAVILDKNANVLYHSKGASTTRFVTSGWFDKAKKQPGTFVTGLYYSESLKNYVFSVAVPVTEGDSVVGYIVSSVDPRRLDQEIQQRQADLNGNIIVVDSRGIVISHDNRTSIEKNTDLTYSLPVQNVINGMGGVVETSQTYDGQYRIVGYSPVPLSGWGVLVTTPMSVVYSQIFQRIAAILALLSGISLLIIAVSFFVSRYLTGPIIELSDTMRRISAGDFRERVRVERKDEIGDLSRTFNSMMDNLERTVELERIVEISKKYQLIFQRARDPIFFTDITGRVLDANKAACQLYGYTREELITKTVSDFRLPGDQPDVQGILNECYDEGCFYEITIVRKDGSTFPAEISSAGASIRNNPVLVAVVRDITERKRAEETLRKQAALIDLSPDGIFVRQPDGTISYWSHGAESLYGWTRAEAIGQKSYVLLKKEFSMTMEEINQQLQQTGFWSGEVIHTAKDGRKIIVQSRWQTRSDKPGEIDEIMESNVDITERKRAEEALADAKSQAELYVDIMAHDINNLNQISLMNLELLQTEENLTADQRETVTSALTTIYGSISLIDNVRKIQKISSGELHPEPIDINAIVSKCIEEAPQPPGKKVEIRFHSSEAKIVTGTTLLKEAFCNLINNSIKYSGSSVRIEIVIDEVLKEGNWYYRTTITDNGYGIPDNVKEKLFRRFQRGTTKAHGKGLGLYIVKMLVERFDGEVWVEDRIPGDYTKGSRFVVLLPVKPASDQGTVTHANA